MFVQCMCVCARARESVSGEMDGFNGWIAVWIWLDKFFSCDNFSTAIIVIRKNTSADDGDCSDGGNIWIGTELDGVVDLCRLLDMSNF
jgi:hypothetical protein